MRINTPNYQSYPDSRSIEGASTSLLNKESSMRTAKPNGPLQENKVVPGKDRREHRRHDFDQQEIAVERWDGQKRAAEQLGTIVDLSASGVRFRTSKGNVRADQQIRV